jgi:ubiquinone/menaquinone biosynthesis C-methylase UbiE
MKTGNMQDKEVLARQYQDSSNLDIRKNFQKKYRTNPMEFTDWIISKIRFNNGCRVLEVGCGTGNLWKNYEELIDTFSELVLTDISDGMIELVRKNYAGRKNIQIQNADVSDLPFDDNSFEIIIANSMLYHVADLEPALENIHRILRDDGVFLSTTFGKAGQLNYIRNAMIEMKLVDPQNFDEVSFTLENGRCILQNHFPVVHMDIFDNHLEVLESMDLVDYIFSMSSIGLGQIDPSNRDKMKAYFESKKDSRGILSIPLMYGMFICKKTAREGIEIQDRQ